MDYKIGDKYKNDAFLYRTSTIVAISPKLDYEGGLSYFVMDEDRGRISYSVEYESKLKEFCEKLSDADSPSVFETSEEASKYKVNEKYIDIECSDLTYTIVFISPTRDFENELSYFCQVQETNGDIWYDVQYEGNMDKTFKKVK
jgi:hypothetical protein